MHPSVYIAIIHNKFPSIFLASNSLKKKGGVFIAIKDTVALEIATKIDKHGRFLIISCELNNALFTLKIYSRLERKNKILSHNILF